MNFKTYFVLGILGLLAAGTLQARVLECSVDILEKKHSNKAVVFVDRMKGSCEDDYSFEALGYGLGLDLAGITAVEIMCPGIDNPEGTFYGVRASVDVSVGLDISEFINGDGACFLVGASVLGLGASISVGTLTIKKRRPFFSMLEDMKSSTQPVTTGKDDNAYAANVFNGSRNGVDDLSSGARGLDSTSTGQAVIAI